MHLLSSCKGLQSCADAVMSMMKVNAYILFPQSEEALQNTRLVLPQTPGCTAFLYNEELVFACSTGTGRGGQPDEKISFNSPGEKRNLGCLKENTREENDGMTEYRFT